MLKKYRINNRKNCNDDLSGRKFNNLLVIEQVGFEVNYENNRQRLWLCKCDCGNEISVVTTQLKTGIKKSCGCANYIGIIHGNSNGDAKLSTWRHHINAYKMSAKKRGLTWELQENECLDLFQGKCHYCGDEPSNEISVYKTKSGKYRTLNKTWADKSVVKTNGIDRIDNNIGYCKDNCVSCRTTCNFAKNNLNYNDFIKWIERLVLYRILKK